MFFLITSCKKNENHTLTNNKLEIGELISNYIFQHEKVKDGVITITARSVFSVKGHEQPDILIDARFFEGRDEQKPFFAGDLNIGDLTIPYFENKDASTSGYCIQSMVDLAPFKRASMMALFGKKVRIKLNSNSVLSQVNLNGNSPTLVEPQFLDANGFYIPATIELESPMFNEDNYSIDISGDPSITWNRDPNNPTGTVFIGIMREMTTDLNNPLPGEIVLFKEVPDIGSYSLSAADTQSLTPGSVASVFIARGSYFTYTNPTTSREILIEAVTYDVVPMVGVKQ